MEAQEDFWRILLVEDDMDDAVIIRVFLHKVKGSMIHLDWVEKDDTAIPLACSGQFDLVIIDHTFRPEGGLKLIEQVRKNCAVPILLLTAWPDPTEAEKALDLGADGILEKDRLSPMYLQEVIQTTLQRSQGPAN